MHRSTRVSRYTPYAFLLCFYLPFYGIARSVLFHSFHRNCDVATLVFILIIFLSFLSVKKYVSMNELRGANRRFLSLRRNALCDCGNPRFYPIHYCLPPFLFRLRRDCHAKRRSQRRNGGAVNKRFKPFVPLL